jgi:hypothetical protein
MDSKLGRLSADRVPTNDVGMAQSLEPGISVCGTNIIWLGGLRTSADRSNHVTGK